MALHRRLVAWMVLFVLPVAVLTAAGRRTMQPGSAASRTIVVASDLHMGQGRNGSGDWHPFEDFRWSSEFGAFLDAVSADGMNAVDLVLNGDTFELLQSSDVACGAGADAGCNETEALARLDRVLTGHDQDIKALGKFARAGSNRVVFVPGDHDAALLFARVGRRVVDALAASSGRVAIAASGRWTSLDGLVVAEHGHQVGLSSDKLEKWPVPFVRRSGRDYLTRSVGERAIQEIYDRLEPQYPVIDNFSAAGSGVKYAFAASGEDIDNLVPALIRPLLLITPWQQFRMELDGGEVKPPIWDVVQARRQGAAFLASSLSDDDPLKPAFVRAAAVLAPLLPQWTDEEIKAVCDYRAAMRRSRRRFESTVTQFVARGPAVSECPRTPETRGAQFDYFWESRDQVFGRYVESVGQQAAKGGRAVVFVHGHTHLADRSQIGAYSISGGFLKVPLEGFSPVRGALLPIVINDGAWQRTITPVQYERIRTERSLSDDRLLRSLRPEELPPCYSFVRIPAYTDSPAPSIRYWREAGGAWAFAGGCGRLNAPA